MNTELQLEIEKHRELDEIVCNLITMAAQLREHTDVPGSAVACLLYAALAVDGSGEFRPWVEKLGAPKAYAKIAACLDPLAPDTEVDLTIPEGEEKPTWDDETKVGIGPAGVHWSDDDPHVRITEREPLEKEPLVRGDGPGGAVPGEPGVCVHLVNLSETCIQCAWNPKKHKRVLPGRPKEPMSYAVLIEEGDYYVAVL